MTGILLCSEPFMRSFYNAIILHRRQWASAITVEIIAPERQYLAAGGEGIVLELVLLKGHSNPNRSDIPTSISAGR